MYTQGDPHELKQKFWHALADAPHVMLQLDADPHSAAPMTTQLDRDARHAIWFFALRDNRFAEMGAATATFVGKGHEVFARFHGTLVEETSRERRDKQWSNVDESWFPGGKDDPNLLMLRMELGEASIWCRATNLFAKAKMMTGADVNNETEGQYAETRL
jgi:general stress protein 26